MLSLHDKLPVTNTLTILPTYQCTAACENCCFSSSPSVKGRIPQERILRYIQEGAEQGIRLLVFSGGEAFLLRHDLNEAIALASSLGMKTRIVSNGYWAIREDVALDKLRALQEVGLDEINFSTGDFHQRFVPVKRVINGVIAAITLGMSCAVMVELHGDRTFTQELLLNDERLSSLLTDESRRSLLTILESPWMPNDPASRVSYQGHEEMLANRHNVHGRKRCSSVLSTVIVDPNEHLGACCGLTRAQIPELDLGSLQERSLQEMVNEAQQDFMKLWIFTEGPERILAWAAEKDPSIEWENQYAHICDACRRVYQDDKVRAVIRQHYEEKVSDVLFRFWLLTAFDAPTSSSRIEDISLA